MLICVCDMCKKEIPKVKKKTIFGKMVEVLDRGTVTCKEWTTNNLLQDFDLCQSCACVVSSILGGNELKDKKIKTMEELNYEHNDTNSD